MVAFTSTVVFFIFFESCEFEQEVGCMFVYVTGVCVCDVCMYVNRSMQEVGCVLVYVAGVRV